MDKHTKQAPRNGNGANSPPEHQSGQPPASPSKAERRPDEPGSRAPGAVFTTEMSEPGT